MTKELRFHGSSDDLFEVEGAVAEEIGGEPYVYLLRSEVEQVGMLITAVYAPRGCPCWSIGICPTEEDAELPTWPIACRLHERGYSTELIIQAPDDVEVCVLKEVETKAERWVPV